MDFITNLMTHINGWLLVFITFVLSAIGLVICYYPYHLYDHNQKDLMLPFVQVSKWIMASVITIVGLYIIIAALYEHYNVHDESGVVIGYQHHENQSEVRIVGNNNTHQSYHVIGLANNFKFKQSDKLYYEKEGKNIYNIKQINDERFDNPFGVHHSLIVFLVVVDTVLLIESFIYYIMKQNRDRNTLPRDMYYVSALIVSFLAILVMIFIMNTKPLDSRHYEITGQIMDVREDTTNSNYYQVEIEDKYGIINIVKAPKPKHKQHYDYEKDNMVKVQVSKPRNIVTHNSHIKDNP